MALVTPQGDSVQQEYPQSACDDEALKQHELPVTAVLGAGHGGLALAGYVAQAGAAVHLWNRTLAPIQAVIALGGIRLDDTMVRPARVSASIAQVLDGAAVVVVAVPANSHRELARSCAPHLMDGQVILLAPGRTGGALEFRRELTQAGCTADVIVGETQTSPLASRMTGPGMAKILGVKSHVAVAALPASRTAELLERCLPLLPMLTPAASVLETSFGSMAAIMHPVITLLNASRIEDGMHSFRFYSEGITPAVVKMMLAVDAERVAIAAAYGIATPGLEDWLRAAFGQEEQDLARLLAAIPAYQEMPAPTGFRHRYLEEDVPAGLVPLAELGAVAGIPCPALDSLISQASVLNDCDYRAEGRNLAALGLDGLNPAAIRRVALQG
jgi:opine dehydrogenase